METLSHWAKSLKSGDKCLATIRHQTEGSKNLINQELTVVHNGELKDSLIGKFNDGTVLRVPYNELTELKLETLYRKVEVSEERKNRIGGNAIEFSEKYKRNSSAVESFTLQQMLREFAISQVSETEDTAQLQADNEKLRQKLQTDKAELLEALEIFIEQNTPTFTSHDYEFPEHVMKAKSLIQKHKQ